MSIDNCQGCDKRLDTDFVEYQVDGTLLCDACLNEQEYEAIEAAFDAVYDKVYVKTDGPVPDYLTTGKVYEVRMDESEDEYKRGGLIADDSGSEIFIEYSGSASIYGRAWTLCDQHGSPVAEQKEESRCTMGVGDGAGNLFVHGDHDSIKAAQNIVLERDRYKALAGELAELLKVSACPANCIGGAYHGHDGEPIQCQFCYERGGALAKYDCSLKEQQEKGV